MQEVTDPNLIARLNSGAQQGRVIKAPSPLLPGQLAGQGLSNQKTEQEIRLERDKYARDLDNDGVARLTKLADAYNGDPTVKTYRVAIGQLGQALQTGTGPQADLALTYAFAKAMDPDSVVRDAEQGMVIESQPWFKAAVENTKKQFGMDGAGQFTPETRDALRRQIINSVSQRVKVYDSRRNYYTAQAEHIGVPVDIAIGEHDAKPFIPALKKWGEQSKGALKQAATGADQMVRAGMPYEQANALVVSSGGQPLDPKVYSESVAYHRRNPDRADPYVVPPANMDDYAQSVAGQGLSGINEGIAGVAGLPVDLATGALNLIPRGINAIANTDIPTIQNPILGSGWIKDRMSDMGAIGAPAATTGGQVVRRVGEGVGASVFPAAAAGSALRAGGQIAVGVGGGLGAAGAQQAFPGNKWAEMAGDILGSGATGAGLLLGARRGATRAMEAQVPTVPQLKEQAGELYRAAESRGVNADPILTQALADNTRAVLAKEGRISPTGRISEVYPKAREGMQLIDDYAGAPMSPTQMQTVRKVVADGMTSKDGTERRLSGILTDTFDEWARPLAPELDQARNVASRYLTAEQLERARELAGSKASQFTGSGFENALRTEYRGLDRAAIKGSQRFSDDVSNAIETVSRGTPASNFARGLGKLAPTGAVPFGVNGGLAAGVGMLGGGPVGAGATMLGLSGLGTAGRAAATHMGIRSADIAELTARNGGALPTAPLLPPGMEQALLQAAIAQNAKYLAREEQADPNQGRQGKPDPLARRKGQRILPPPSR